MNKAENEAGNKAVDSLINYETVKVTIIPVTLFTAVKKEIRSEVWDTEEPRPLDMKVNINYFICAVSVIGEEMNADT